MNDLVSISGLASNPGRFAFLLWCDLLCHFRYARRPHLQCEKLSHGLSWEGGSGLRPGFSNHAFNSGCFLSSPGLEDFPEERQVYSLIE